MANIILFVVTVVVYFAIITSTQDLKMDKKTTFLTVVFIGFLCMPFNIKGNVYTVFGNATSEKSIYSVFSVFQYAKEDAFTFFGTVFQRAGDTASVVAGVTLIQYGHKNARTMFSVNVLQASYGTAENDVGINFFQTAKICDNGIAVSIIQNAGHKWRVFGVGNFTAD